MLIHRDSCTGADEVEYMNRSGVSMRKCRSCRAAYPVELLDEPPSRYVLDCIRCSRVIRLDRPNPRVPLCSQCRR